MIFKRFFAPAHTSAKPEKRMQAIDNLSPDKAQDKTILHELAFNDENTDVSLAALQKLNSFVLWLKMAQIAKDNRIKKTAEKKVNDALLGNSDLALTNQEKATFLTESASADVIVKIVQNDHALINDDTLIKALINKVNKPSFTQYVLANGASTALQSQLIAETADIAVLQKWAKKSTDNSFLQVVEARIEAINSAAQKPVELKKQLTLCLSKYQALTDKNDVEYVMQQKAELDSELAGLAEQFELLNASDQKEFSDKQSRIVEQVERYIARIKPEWEEKQHAAQIAQIKALYEQQLAHASVQVDWLYNERLCDATLADVATVNESVRAVEASLEQLGRLDESINVTDKNHATLQALNDKLDRFSIQQQYGQKLLIKLDALEVLASKITTFDNGGETQVGDVESVDTIDDLKKAFDEQCDAYDACSAELIRVPKSLATRFKNARSNVKAKEKAQEKAQNEQLKFIRKQLGIVENLISQGKFRVALSKFGKLDESVKALPQDSYRFIEKRYQKTADEVSRLEGWQDYLAAPRKPALIEEAITLADTPVDNVKARSSAIKHLRQQWLTLTPVNQESDDDVRLQKAFDEALERAFEPCRQHYAKLDAAREEALKTRQAIISSVKELDLEMPANELSKAFDKLAKQWHSAGQVEHSVYEQLKQQWKQNTSAIQRRVHEWQVQNQTEKRALIDKVNALLNADDLGIAADDAQAAQRAWKEIGHAGKREESKLWAEFKQANDAIFERIKAHRKSQNNEANTLADALFKSLDNIDVNMAEEAFDAALDDVAKKSVTLPKALQGKVKRKIDTVTAARQSHKNEARKQAVNARANALVSLLDNKYASSEQADELKQALGKRWTSLLDGVEDNQSTRHDRRWFTVALEVACDIQSPDSDSSLRTNVQLQMMTAKLENGESSSASELLSQWLLCGEITQEDEHLTQRLINVVENNPEVVA